MKKLMCDYCDYEAQGETANECVEDMIGHCQTVHAAEMEAMSDIDKKAMMEEALMRVTEA